MAFKLTSGEIKTRDEHVLALRNAADAIQTALDEANRAIEDLIVEINDKIARYNGTLADAQSFVEDIATRLREEYDGKSEKWQESDKASEVDNFISEWENWSIDEVREAEQPTLFEDDLPTHADDIEALGIAVE